MTNSVDPDQTAPIGAVCSGSTLFASILNLSVMLGNYLQQTTSAEDVFRCIFFLALLGLTRIKLKHWTSLNNFSSRQTQVSSADVFCNIRPDILHQARQNVGPVLDSNCSRL